MRGWLTENAGWVMQAAYEHIQEQLPTSPGTKQDVWLYVLPIQGRMRQTHSSEASESLAMPSFSREQQQRRIEAQRSCENLLEASSAQAHLHRLSMDMGASYHSPRCRFAGQNPPNLAKYCLLMYIPGEMRLAGSLQLRPLNAADGRSYTVHPGLLAFSRSF